MGKQAVKSKKGPKSNPSNNSQNIDNVQAKPQKRRRQPRKRSKPVKKNDPILFESDHGTDEEDQPSTEDLKRLLEPYSKDQLITFLTDAAADDPGLLSHIRSVADNDIAHRKIFVRSIGWDVTTETLLNAFRPYGSIVDSKIVVDKVSGRNKGYGFVVFSNRSSAVKALKEPEKKIGTRMTSCHLASISYVARASSSKDFGQRRIYVSNVPTDVSPDKLKDFFATFGEIESGPTGFDAITGKCRGFAIFVYKTQDGANRALQEPFKMFEGHRLNCKVALDRSQKEKFPFTPPAPQSLPVINQQPALNGVAAAQNVAMLGQNPAYSMLFVQNPLFTNATLNPNSLAALNPAALAAFNPTGNLVTPQGQGYGVQGYGAQGYGAQGYGGLVHGGVGLGLGVSNAFGTYRTQESAASSYGGSQLGQSPSLTPATGFYRSLLP
ncbi:UBP1-associated protein 2B-like isoform X5 [Phalaenopsis equestris]|uniref:UBP1-associated protein 2B-like isoform X1 n=1 Tax=Phalaenopsis equestris TaxID=78828 RepID=UPI0009E508B5|nr:UBP1-associated protein 2B-like isoform X1 [Phalaenopsis equestris]XP_020586633.1 UBP1-associated protein 2B-like isoform X1 [Phalaenopsis equestris]XP_020586634.1 UBP1-associated protein 2B-like isoform X2 [Phalaenopsis equestris]XP_020586635.1 UBP1-associated protein 2B-like isoform X3 [Phalaenopsis equestris]XP_020586636.1 UBP1-associated protein 2B-like isoform X4 [Phalaenopsis equestris]XP_020586637.1 UBP1-associated protein 2B-like isoform X5 [Phalaenopsis equestris]